MPEPQAHPHAEQIKAVARQVLIATLVISGLKFAAFALSNSAAVLSDALESIINIAAAAFMLYTLWLSNRPADRDHPYGHGKIEFMAVGLEGWFILLAGLYIGFEGIRRLMQPPELNARVGLYLLVPVALLSAGLAFYLWRASRRLDSDVLLAHSRHLFTDVGSTLGGVAALLMVDLTGKKWVDPVAALLMAALILWTSWRLLWHSIGGLMDRSDPKDEALIHDVLEAEVASGHIKGFHKVRHRHSGPFHWVDMHLQISPDLSVQQGHEIASRIEHAIEQRLGQANATAHVEPYENEQPQTAHDAPT